MGRLRAMAGDCKHKETADRHLTEQIINGLNNDGMATEIISDLIAIINTSSVTSRQVLVWEKRVETQRAEMAMLDSLKENRV